MDVPVNSPRTLGRAECLDLLRSSGTGRIGYSQRALPAITMVSYAVVDDLLTLRLAADAPELPWLRNTVVAFQTDRTHPAGHQAWSVTCVGLARPVSDPDRLAAVLRAARGEGPLAAEAFLLMDPGMLEGRAFHELSLTTPPLVSGAAAPAS